MQDDSNKTPASARHKRGCNCKKSSCLKKYCECFQVLSFCSFFVLSLLLPSTMGIIVLCLKGGVGCSIGCRCEGCKNTFGRKDGECLYATSKMRDLTITLLSFILKSFSWS